MSISLKQKIEYTDSSKKPPLSNNWDHQALKISTRINKLFWKIIGVWCTYKLVDSGLSHFLALETLIHGTGPLGFLGISLNGADPIYGGGDTGSSVGIGLDHHITNSKNYFHVFRDSGLENLPFTAEIIPSVHLLGPITMIYAKVHAVGSAMAVFGYPTAEGISKALRLCAGIVCGVLTPTLKFRFKPEAILNCISSCRFEKDPDYHGCAYRTAQPISSTHLGIMGSLSQGIGSGTLSRMANNPRKVLEGAAFLLTAFFVARATYRYLNTSSSQEEIQAEQKQIRKSKTWFYTKEALKIFAKVGIVFVMTL